MVSRDYTKEIGLETRTKRVPLPVAFVIFAVFGAIVWYGVSHTPSHSHAPKAAPAAPAKPAAE